MVSVLTWHPSGRITNDRRPGHTLPGLMFYLDPFQREAYIRLARVSARIE